MNIVMLALACAYIAAFAVVAVALNISYYRQRRHMTPEQRRQADEETRAWLAEW